jgi:RNA polymerase sigma-70 factor (ECF subfamily)
MKPEGDESSRARRYLRGDRDAFREVDAWIARVLRARYASLAQERPDLAQSVHEKIVSGLRSDRLQRHESLQAYVNTVAHRTAIDELRRRYRECAGLRTGEANRRQPAPSPYDLLELRERSRLLHHTLHLCSEDCRELWRMTFLEGLSYEEIGRRLGIPPGTVKSRAFHCRRRAREILRELEGAARR